MPQKPQDRARKKRRDTKRLERWRAKKGETAKAAPKADKPAKKAAAK